MSMESVAWSTMYRSANGPDLDRERQRGNRGVTVRRIMAFATPHRGKLTVFMILSVVVAVLTVLTPVLAGQVVNEIVDGGVASTVVWLSVLIALIALAEAGAGLVV